MIAAIKAECAAQQCCAPCTFYYCILWFIVHFANQLPLRTVDIDKRMPEMCSGLGRDGSASRWKPGTARRMAACITRPIHRKWFY